MASIGSRRATNLYGVGVGLVLAVVVFMSVTQPTVTPRPAEQATLFEHVPAALDPHGAPPVPSSVREGGALAYLEIPRFGDDWVWAVVEGVSLDDLALGPGHYPGSPLMGEAGNAAFAAHRATHGDPFIDFDLLRVGDKVTFKQSGAWWTYTLTTAPRIIEPTERWVLDTWSPGRTLTLTTCWPRYGSSKRMFVRAVLTDWS